MIPALLIVLAVVLFLLAAFGVGGRVNLGWLGLAALTLALGWGTLAGIGG